jgi:hypothetical protein
MSDVMSDEHFYSARLRLARAKEHLFDLKTRIDGFCSKEPYTRFKEPDPTDSNYEIHKVRLTERFPFRWRILATEIIEHARSSLDHATWASAYLFTGNPNTEFGYFPFVKDAKFLANKIKGVSKDCPPEIKTLLAAFQPYPGGNDLLYALNGMCNSSKHALITFITNATADGQISGIGLIGPIEIYEPLVLDPMKNEIAYARVPLTTYFEHEIDLTIYPSIEYRERTSTEPATLILHWMIKEAEKIVSAIEAKCRHIGLIK